MLTNLPHLLLNRNKTYYLRYIFPIDLAINKNIRKEVRFSLFTKSLEEAFILYHKLNSYIRQQLRHFQYMSKIDSELEIQHLKIQIKEMLREYIDDLRENAAMNNSHWRTEIAERRLKSMVFDQYVEPVARLTLENKAQKSELAKLSSDNEEINKQHVELLKHVARLKTGVVSSSTPLSTTSNSKEWHDLSKIYLSEKQSAIGPKTYRQLVSNIERFIEIVGYDLNH